MPPPSAAQLLAWLLPAPGVAAPLDGALATHLEALGAHLAADPLWSCRALVERPELVRRAHLDYFRAGARVATTASYQATTRGLKEHRGLDEAQAREIIASSVVLAKEARAEYLRGSNRGGNIEHDASLLVAGSVGPYGAYLADGSEYRGEYGDEVSLEFLKDFHRPRVEALVGAGADLLALETMPNLLEIQSLVELLREPQLQGVGAWLALSLRQGDATRLADGTNLSAVAAAVENSTQIVALGVNCVARELVTPALAVLQSCSTKALLAYPNSGETWDACTKTWSRGNGATSNGWEELVRQWRRVGARLIGGCCRTGPEDIQAIRAATGRPLSCLGDG